MGAGMSRLLVMGPGRSGSKYMNAMMLSLGFESLHESSMMFLNGKYIHNCLWENAATWLEEKDNRALSGFPYGLMVAYLRYKIPKLQVICVHRSKHEWTNSRSAMGWMPSRASFWPEGLRDKEHYWDIYESLMQSVAPPVLHLKMKELDDCKPQVKQFTEATP
jgi:hypothetical protein